MLALEERFMIRELYRKGVSISEIARRTGRDRKTIRQVVNAPELAPARHPRQAKACKIDPYAPYLELRMAEGVFNARKLYGEILAQGYPGKESKVREFVHERRPDKEPMGSVRFETAPGEQGQVDWGSFGFITHHGRTYRLYAFVMTLGWSRASYLRFTICSDTTWFIRCHLHAFAYLGGVPKRLLYDNLKSVVLRRDSEDVVQWNPRFLDFADVAGFAPQACKPRRPQTKGKVEHGVKYVRGNFWPGLHFRDLDDLNTQALAWLNTTANPRVHGTTGEVPFTRLRSEGLQPADKALSYDTSVLVTRRSSKDCFISYAGNLYSVPAAYARKTLQVKITEAEELVICSEGGDVLARHRILCGRQERSVQVDHYRGLGTPGSRIEQAAAMQEGAPEAPSLFWEAPVVARPLARRLRPTAWGGVMNEHRYQHLQTILERLKLTRLSERLDQLAEEAAKESWTYVEFLDRVFDVEVSARVERDVAMKTRLARFPFVKTLEQFDFSFQPALHEAQMRELATARFVAHGENILSTSSTGRGENASRR